MQVRLRGERLGDVPVQLYIDPATCFECGASELACPVGAIFEEQDLPDEYKSFIALNANFFNGQ